MSSAGTDQTLIKCLLEDALQWDKLRTVLALHVSAAKDLLTSFKTKEFLFAELMNLNQLYSAVDSDDDSPDPDAEDEDSLETEESDAGTDDEGPVDERSTDEDFDGGQEDNMEAPDTENLEGIKKLTRRIVRFEEECTAGISYLNTGSKEMIDLVSIDGFVRLAGAESDILISVSFV